MSVDSVRSGEPERTAEQRMDNLLLRLEGIATALEEDLPVLCRPAAREALLELADQVAALRSSSDQNAEHFAAAILEGLPQQMPEVPRQQGRRGGRHAARDSRLRWLVPVIEGGKDKAAAAYDSGRTRALGPAVAAIVGLKLAGLHRVVVAHKIASTAVAHKIASTAVALTAATTVATLPVTAPAVHSALAPSPSRSARPAPAASIFSAVPITGDHLISVVTKPSLKPQQQKSGTNVSSSLLVPPYSPEAVVSPAWSSSPDQSQDAPAPQAAGQLAVDDAAVDLTMATSAQITLSASGGQVAWTAQNVPDGIRLNIASGKIWNGMSYKITVSRSADLTGTTVTFTLHSSQNDIPVTVSLPAPPPAPSPSPSVSGTTSGGSVLPSPDPVTSENSQN